MNSTFLVVIHALILVFLVARHYNWLPELAEDVDALVEGPAEEKTTETPTRKGKATVLTDQTTVFHSGHSLGEADKGPMQHTIANYKASVNSLYTGHNIGLFGIDISHWQGKIDWSKEPEGEDSEAVDFVIVKATQGAKYVDSQFENNWKGAAKAGKKRGAYHFYIYADDPTAQAENYLSYVDFKKDMVRPIVDLELDCADCAAPGIPKDKLVSDVRTFLKAVEDKTGQRPIIYSYSSFYDTYLKEAFSDYDVWLARYTTFKPDEIPVLPGETESTNPTYVMWQFTNKEPIQAWGESVDASVIPALFVDQVFIE